MAITIIPAEIVRNNSQFVVRSRTLDYVIYLRPVHTGHGGAERFDSVSTLIIVVVLTIRKPACSLRHSAGAAFWLCGAFVRQYECREPPVRVWCEPLHWLMWQRLIYCQDTNLSQSSNFFFLSVTHYRLD